MKNDYFFIVVFCIFLSQKLAVATHSDNPPSLSSSAIKDLDYKRLNVHEQIALQRRIFNGIYQKVLEENPDASFGQVIRRMATMYDSGFLDVFLYGLINSREYVKKYLPETYNTYIKFAEEMWQKAQEADREKRLTGANFINFNILLAEIIRVLKKEPKVNKDEYSFENERPIFVIYAHPDKGVKNRGASKKTFVDEYVGDGLYPSWLAKLDVHSDVRDKGTKRDPHFSTENGVLRMFLHDLNHCKDVKLETAKHYFSTIKAGHEVLQVVRQRGHKAEAQILVDGLFVIFHERKVLNFLPNKIDPSRERPCHERLLQAAQEMAKNPIVRPVQTVGISYRERLKNYKEEDRDQEAILYNIDKNGESFLATIALDNHKKRALPIAIEKYETTDFISLESLENERFVIIERKEDFTNNMRWALHHRDIPEDITEMRHQKLNPKKKEAYKKFWDRFGDIITQTNLGQ